MWKVCVYQYSVTFITVAALILFLRFGFFRAFDLHVEGVDSFLGAVDNDADTKPEGTKDIEQAPFEPAEAEECDRSVDEHKIQPHLGRAGGQVGNLELVGRTEGQKGVNHQAAHPQRQKPHEFVIDAIEQKGPSDEDRTHEHKVQKVVHVEAPFDKPLIAMAADGPVEAVGKPLQEDHQR